MTTRSRSDREVNKGAGTHRDNHAQADGDDSEAFGRSGFMAPFLTKHYSQIVPHALIWSRPN